MNKIIFKDKNKIIELRTMNEIMVLMKFNLHNILFKYAYFKFGKTLDININ